MKLNTVSALLLSLGVAAAAASAEVRSPSPADCAYANPVMPGDYPDPSIIRVGKDFWASATSSEWGPPFPLLHSTDLVNWEVRGAVFAHRPEWAVGNFWAPEISEYKGRYYVYYVARKRGGPLAIAVASAKKPQGPYTDHGVLVAQEAGSIDAMPVSDENGRRYLVWKEDGNSRKLPTILWAQPLSEDGLQLLGEPKELFRNDAPWEGAVIEGPFIVRHGGWFYLFYSGSGCCGAGCNYALGVARAKALLGPWEKNPVNPILPGNADWKCPGHGSIVRDQHDRYWLLYHAYSAEDFIYTGREAMLDEVRFGADGWPTITEGKGPSTHAASPFGATQRRHFSFEDEFTTATLRAGWQWPQDNEPVYRVKTSRGGRLVLAPGPKAATAFTGAILARATTSGDYTATTVLDASALEGDTLAGIAAIGDPANAVGLAAGKGGKLVLWRRDKGHQTTTATEFPNLSRLHLKLSADHGRNLRFAASPDGKQWVSIGEMQSGDKLPPWDRSVRVGLTVGGMEGAKGTFEAFRLVAGKQTHP